MKKAEEKRKNERRETEDVPMKMQKIQNTGIMH